MSTTLENVSTETLEALNAKTKNGGGRLFEDDLPGELHTLNEVMQKYSPEYTIKFELMRRKLETLGEELP